MKELILPSSRRIAIYDDLFTLDFRSAAFQFATRSFFQIGWEDSLEEKKRGHVYLHAFYSPEDVARLGILEAIAASEAAHELRGYVVEKVILNLSTPADSNFVHTHPEDKVLLYYVNLDWQDGWHGETLFFSENTKEVCYASPYTPGRLIAFDARVPHTIRPQSHIAVKFRFTLAIVLKKIT